MPIKSNNRTLDEHLHILIAQGNHEAFVQLRKRYHKHALVLTTELLRQYLDTGISRKELVAVCEDHFPFVINKYYSGMASFYSFWRESTLQVLMDYLIENSYDGDAYQFKGVISFDQSEDGRHYFSDFIAERGDEKLLKRKVFEIRQFIKRHEVFFTFQEKALLNLLLEGYTLADLEHTGLLAKSHLYLTYKSAVEKLRTYMNKGQ